jgi:hypothetical protein
VICPEAVLLRDTLALKLALNGLTDEQCNELAREVAQVAYSAPPGADRLQYLADLLARADAGTTSYVDVIALEGCSRLDVLRAFSGVMMARRALNKAEPGPRAGD